MPFTPPTHDVKDCICGGMLSASGARTAIVCPACDPQYYVPVIPGALAAPPMLPVDRLLALQSGEPPTRDDWVGLIEEGRRRWPELLAEYGEIPIPGPGEGDAPELARNLLGMRLSECPPPPLPS